MKKEDLSETKFKKKKIQNPKILSRKLEILAKN